MVSDAPDGWRKKTITDARGTRVVYVPALDPNSRRRPGRGRHGIIPSAEPMPRVHRASGPAIRRGGTAKAVGQVIARLQQVLGPHVVLCIESWKTEHPDGDIEVNWHNRWVVFARQLGGEEFIVGYPFSEMLREVAVKHTTPASFRQCVDRHLEDVRYAQQGPLPEEVA